MFMVRFRFLRMQAPARQLNACAAAKGHSEPKANNEKAGDPLLPKPHTRALQDPGAYAAGGHGIGPQHQHARHFLSCSQQQQLKRHGTPMRINELRQERCHKRDGPRIEQIGNHAFPCRGNGLDRGRIRPGLCFRLREDQP